MKPAPPVLGRALLWLCLPEAEGETIPGDLEEEFSTVVLPRLGASAARRWFWRHVLRSVAPMMRMRCRHGEWSGVLAVAAGFCVAPVMALEWVWSLVLSQIPLKADSVRGLDYLVLSLTAALVSALAGGYALARGRGWRDGVVLALLVLLMNPCVVLALAGRTPWWYQLALGVVSPGAALLGAWVSRRQRASSGGPG